ncbi:MAG: hypothetical protein K2X34_00510 [Hyphomonadaceae bacterium]|nr:hypothetical protein [Hyphomonadaceae bacterium]
MTAGKMLRADGVCACWRLQGAARMGTAADYTIIVLLVAIGVGLWTMFDRIVQMQRDIEALKHKAGLAEAPPAPASTALPPVE